MQKISTINLHNFQDDIFFGFHSQQPNPDPTPDSSYFGGTPSWLSQPPKQLLKCSQCSQTNLTFLGQIYCPLNVSRCYHRILYILFCEKCSREFKCIRQQAPQSHNLEKCKSIKSNLRRVSENSYEIDSDSMGIKELNKLITKIRREMQENKVIEEENEDQEEDEKQLKEYEKKVEPKMMKEMQMEEMQQKMTNLKINQTQKQQIDQTFEEYKKIMTELNGPSMLYTNQSIPYNSLPLNPRHNCKHCGNKLSLQVQITEKVLLIESGNPESKLLMLDWGSLMIYTCMGSCDEGKDECVIAQYEREAIKQEQVKKLKKKKKNKKKKQQKERSKSKKKEEKEEKEIEEQEEDNEWA